MVSQENTEEFNKIEGKIIIAKHKQKTFNTLEVLMAQFHMMFYWERIKRFFFDRQPTLDELSKLMSRCLKLYNMID